MPATRVLRYLERAEAAETDPDYQDSYRLAWITLHFACHDQSFPFVQAFYRMFGCHPDKMAEKLEARRRAQLGPYYKDFWPSGSSPPKKAPESETLIARRAAAGKG